MLPEGVFAGFGCLIADLYPDWSASKDSAEAGSLRKDDPAFFTG